MLNVYILEDRLEKELIGFDSLEDLEIQVLKIQNLYESKKNKIDTYKIFDHFTYIDNQENGIGAYVEKKLLERSLLQPEVDALFEKYNTLKNRMIYAQTISENIAVMKRAIMIHGMLEYQ